MAVLGGLIGDSPGLVAVRTQVEQFLRRQSGSRRFPPVLILGETGTGKGLLARAMHDTGPRAHGPFVALNCAAIPETLLEAELFGFEQGAFTDARHAKAGLFQTAHRGTLFLDEIALLPESLQAKLLTVLEDRAVRRLGSTRSEAVDVWIVAATSEEMKPGARHRRLREDLFHRLAVVTFQLPALRERDRDIITLAEYFLARTCADYGLAPKRLTEDAGAALLAHRWPGNVRELANMMERVALLSDTPVVAADSLELGPPRGQRTARPHTDDVSALSVPEAPSLRRAVGEIEQARICAALTETGGNISRAATRLGITRNTLRYRLKKYGLEAPYRPIEPPAPAAPASVEGEPAPLPAVHVQWDRRYVAVLRADFVAASEAGRLPDTGPVLETLLDKIYTFGGQIEEVSPRGLVAGFGLEPVEDAPRRAAHAALAIRRILAHGLGGLPEFPGVRVGLHVGEVMVGRLGRAARLDHEFKREAWTLLEAFMRNAEPGTILLSDATRPFLERRFVVVPSGDGAGGEVYRLEGVEQTGLGLGDQHTPFVARGRELEQLAQALERAKTGHGQVVAVLGEAGVGKSRLLWEFVNSQCGRDSLILISSGASHGQATPYLPVIDLLKRYFRIEPRDDAGRLEERVTEKFRSLGPALSPARSAILSLLDVAPDDSQWLSLDPSQKLRRTLDAVKLLLLEESRIQPVLLVVEDLHWIDSKTQAVLDTLIDGLASHRVLLLVSYRPEYEHGWVNKSCYAQLRLDPLSPGSARVLLDCLMGGNEAAAALKADLIERTGGNPFFLEESVQALVETGVLVGTRGTYRVTRSTAEIRIPDTIQAVLAARIGRLPPEDRKLLHTAAVIGLEVPLALLRRVADLEEEPLRAGLLRLQRSEFLHETGLVPETRYAFKHALGHEASYAGLLQDRRNLHVRIMEAIEHSYGNRLAEHADRLAYHAARGEVWDKALAYSRQAGAKAAERSAYQEAVVCFEQALAALTHMPESREALEQGIDLRIELRNSLFPRAEFGKIFEHLREAEALTQQIGDRGRLGWVSFYKAAHFWNVGNPDRVLDPARRALAVAHTGGDLALQIVTTVRLGQAYLTLGEYREARKCFLSNIQLIEGDLVRERFGEAWLPSVFSRCWLVQLLGECGEFAEGIARGIEGLRIAEMVDHPHSIIGACRALGLCYLRKGELDAAIRFLERGVELCREARVLTARAALASYLGYAHVLSGRPARGLQLLEQGTALDASTGEGSGYAYHLVHLSEAYRLAHRVEEAVRSARQALDFARDHHQPPQQAWALWGLAEIDSHREPAYIEEAEASYRQAMSLCDELGMRPLVAHCHLGVGKLHVRTGKRREAREHLVTATAMYREMDMRFWLEQAEAALNCF